MMELNMPDASERNDQLKAAMKQTETPLNKDGGKGQIPCAPKQVKDVSKYTSLDRGGPYKK